MKRYSKNALQITHRLLSKQLPLHQKTTLIHISTRTSKCLIPNAIPISHRKNSTTAANSININLTEFNKNTTKPKDLLNDEIRNSFHTLRTKNKQRALMDLNASTNSGMLTLTGYKGSNSMNQDGGFLLSPYYNGVILGVMDGHGTKGELVSYHTIQQLPYLLHTKLNNNISEDRIKQAIIDTFHEVDHGTKHMTGGCSASIILKYDDKVYIANAGDSRSFIVCYNEDIKVIYASREDKPSLPDEAARIHGSGGQVYIPKDTDETCRVLYTNPTTNITTGLAMSRSIGDWDAKTVGVISTPIVDVIDLKDYKGKVFGVCVTDGMLDYITLDSMAARIAHGLYSEKSDDNNYDHPLLAAEELVLTAALGWTKDFGNRYRDDITIVFTDLSI